MKIVVLVGLLYSGLLPSAHSQTTCDLGRSGITLYGELASPVHFELAALRGMPGISVRGVDHDGKVASFEGVTLSSLLQQAGVPSGSSLRGRANQMYVIVEASDGYAAVLALAETDSSFRAEVPVVAWSKNGAPLDASAGPLQLIVPEDRRHGRRVRQVRCIRIGAAASGRNWK